ncbi:Flp pilus assembly protein CpaB [Vibrio sp. S4M6]|uniref:Flp pilus assembly protein CpaB n=1 Tax=Vibrio sinus TaxID=2946865 RepID=UPI00202AA944|nr:Flp pilus assembly protein CpaB [Vibrio sinus]
MKSKILLVIAVVAILVGLYGVAGSLVHKPKPAPQKNPNIQVWRLKQNVHSGEIISRRMLSVEQVSQKKANELGFTQSVNLAWKQGAVFRQNLNKGSYLSEADLVQPDAPGYIDFVIGKNRVAFPIAIDPNSVVGGVITNGSKVDVLAIIGISKSSGGFAPKNSTNKSITVKPLFIGIKVLQVKKLTSKVKIEGDDKSKSQTVVVLELTRKQAVTLTVAQQVSHIKIDRSVGQYTESDLQADSGDILPHFQDVAEYRADKMQIN